VRKKKNRLVTQTATNAWKDDLAARREILDRLPS
jgi:hypothetical protein